jgi:hypothetical protein
MKYSHYQQHQLKHNLESHTIQELEYYDLPDADLFFKISAPQKFLKICFIRSWLHNLISEFLHPFRKVV